MSIYSGFATRQQQEVYNSYLEGVINLLQKRILKVFHNEEADDSKFAATIRKLHSSMRKMEKYKYLEPKLSQAFSQLVEHFVEQDERCKVTSRSEIQSISNIGASEPIHPKNPSSQLIMQTPTMVQQLNLIKQYRENTQKRAGTADAFRIKRPMTTKYSSAQKRPFSEDKIPVPQGLPNNPNDDDSIRQVLDQYLSGRPNSNQKLSKAQKNYLRFFKRQKNSLSEALQQQNRKK